MTKDMTPELSVEADEDARKPFRDAFPGEKTAKELAKLAFSDMGDYVRTNADGSTWVVPFDKLKKGSTAAIKKIKETEKVIRDDDEAGETVLSRMREFELHDKQKALEAGARLAGYEPKQKQEIDFIKPLRIMYVKPQGNDKSKIRKPRNGR